MQATYRRGERISGDDLFIIAQGIDIDSVKLFYTMWGDQAATHLKRDFSFIVVDQAQQCIYGARSPIGMCNLVYYYDGKRFSCASTLAQLLEDTTISRTLDTQWIAYWLVYGHSHWGMTPYANIKELLPGHSFKMDASGLTIKPFWQPTPRTTLHYKDQRDYAEHLLTLLEQIISEIPDNAIYDISGGLDSSSIVCLAARNQTITTFHAQAGPDKYVQSVSEQYHIN
jgi:asparagine synthase (glutamine-hydrolysing)